MAKELYLYSGIYSWTAESLLSQLEENKATGVVIRMNTNGGDPQAAFGVIAKMKERAQAGKDTIIAVDGKAYSTGFYMLPYASKVRALSVSSFLVHRAAYSDYYEKTMSAEEKKELEKVNADLRKALESKIDEKKFTKITGVTFDQIFDVSQRIDVTLDGAQALKCGLVDELVNINENEMSALHKFYEFSETTKGIGPVPPAVTAEHEEQKLNKVEMDLKTLKASHPELFAEVVKIGVDQERDRVGSFMAFHDIDPEAVAKGIKDGSVLSATAMAEFGRKAFSAESLKKVEADSPETVVTAAKETVEKTGKEKIIADYEAEVDKRLGLKK